MMKKNGKVSRRSRRSIFDSAIDRDIEKHLHRLIDRNLETINLPENTRLSDIKDAMNYICFPMGKLLRERMVLAVGRKYGVKKRTGIIHAAGVGAIQSGTLAEDDKPSQDAAIWRRDKTSCWLYFMEKYKQRLFDEGDEKMRLRIAAGEFDQNAEYYGVNVTTFAVHQLGRNVWYDILNGPASPVQKLRILKELWGTDAVLMPGQIRDCHYTLKLENLTSFTNFYIEKTGVLFGAAAAIGAMLGRRKEATIAKWRDFGVNLGVAYQLSDDLNEKFGKALTDKSVETYRGKKTVFDVADINLILETRNDFMTRARRFMETQVSSYGMKHVTELVDRMDSIYRQAVGGDSCKSLISQK